jgi:hypothetical protein
MRKVYMPAGAALVCLLALVMPRFSSERLGASDMAATKAFGPAAAQLAQDDSNGSNSGVQPYQSGDDNSNANDAGTDNPDQPGAQPGDDTGSDSSQANPSYGDSGSEPPQMSASPDQGSGENPADQNNQDSDDSQNSANPSDLQ